MSDDCEEQLQGKAERTWLGGKDTDESNEAPAIPNLLFDIIYIMRNSTVQRWLG
jgi:hypothetical protein